MENLSDKIQFDFQYCIWEKNFGCYTTEAVKMVYSNAFPFNIGFDVMSNFISVMIWRELLDEKER